MSIIRTDPGMRGRCSRLAALAFATLLLTPLPGFAAQTRNIILMIGDGMGPSHIGAAMLYSTGELGRNLRMVELMNSGRTAYLANDTADAIVTESAAAATQIACGVKVPARVVGMGPDGRTPCLSILEIARQRGMATGLVTTSGITDATPAAFSAHVETRSDETAIAAQQLGLGVDVLLGGARRFFLPESAGGSRSDGRNLVEEARRAGYALARNASELARLRSAKILGLFSMGTMAFEIDRALSTEPSLGEMTAKALDVLSQNSRGLFVMIEAGRIDHAAHGNDLAAVVRDMLAFDEAIGVALEFQRKHPDTLIIVTADHETGGLALTGMGGGKGINFPAIRNTRSSLDAILGYIGESPTAAKVRSVAASHLALALSDEEAQLVASELHRKDAAQPPVSTSRTLMSLLQRHLGASWATRGHTASPVFAFGSGAGAEAISGFRHNTELFRIMRDALGAAQ